MSMFAFVLLAAPAVLLACAVVVRMRSLLKSRRDGSKPSVAARMSSPKLRSLYGLSSARVCDDDVSTQAASSDCASSSGSDDEADHGLLCRIARRSSRRAAQEPLECVIQRDLLLCMRPAVDAVLAAGLRAQVVPDSEVPQVAGQEAALDASPSVGAKDLKLCTVRAEEAPLVKRSPPGLALEEVLPSFDLALANARWRRAIAGDIVHSGEVFERGSWRKAIPSLEQRTEIAEDCTEEMQASKKGALTGALGASLRPGGKLLGGLGSR